MYHLYYRIATSKPDYYSLSLRSCLSIAYLLYFLHLFGVGHTYQGLIWGFSFFLCML